MIRSESLFWGIAAIAGIYLLLASAYSLGKGAKAVSAETPPAVEQGVPQHQCGGGGGGCGCGGGGAAAR